MIVSFSRSDAYFNISNVVDCFAETRIIVMALKYQFKETFHSQETCLAAMMNESSKMTVLHCRPEWDQYTQMCWGPAPAGGTAFLSCPDDGYLNPKQFASRLCLSNGSWFVNKTFDQDRAYTNFGDCFLPEDLSVEDDLKNLVDNKIIFILKSLDEYQRLYLTVRVVSVTFLVASIIISSAVVVKLRQKCPSTYSYVSLAVAAAALLMSNAVTVSVNSVDDATNVRKCRSAKALELFSIIVFYQCIFVYLYLCIVPILQIVIRPLVMKLAISGGVILTVALLVAEQLLEMYSRPSRYCGFRTLQSTFHWLTSAPKWILVMSNMCLDSVTIFGTFCLHQPHLEKACELHHIRQKAICTLIFVLYSILTEILFVLIHSEAYLHYSKLPVDVYLQAYSLVTAAQGIVFSTLLCFLDSEVLAMIGLPVRCQISQKSSKGNKRQAVRKSKCHFEADMSPVYDLEYRTTGVDGFSENAFRVDMVFHTARPEDSLETQTKLYESKLFL